MNKLSVLACLISVLMAFSSCSTYYYTVLSSNDKKGWYDDRQDYVVENDSMIITYCFYGEDAPVSVTVFNKLDEPVFVDWQRSALIVGDKATSFYREAAPLQGVVETTSTGDAYRWNGRYSSVNSSSRGTFAGEIQLPKGTEFVPPHSKVESKVLNMEAIPFKEIPAKRYEKQPFARANGGIIHLNTIKYSAGDSPMRFRSYLTFYTNPSSPKYFTCENSFYASRIIKAGSLAPSALEAGKREDGNISYTRDQQGKQVAAIVGYTALGIAAVTGVILLVTQTPTTELPSVF